MKICFPVELDKGLESEVYGHFGSAPVFVVFDTEAKSISTINNQDLGHTHGMCNPLKALLLAGFLPAYPGQKAIGCYGARVLQNKRQDFHLPAV